MKTSLVSLLLVAATVAVSPSVRAASCPGDCDGDGRVAINEVILGVNIVLGVASLSECLALDPTGTGSVSVGNLIASVSSALCGCMGCPPGPTATPTRPPTATPEVSATATSTPPTPGQVLFLEGWQRAKVGSYHPRGDSSLVGNVIGGDTGDWIVIDTVSNFPDCGPSPQYAEIVTEDGSRRLELHSFSSNSDCADNISVGSITRSPPMERGLDADLTDDTFLSFHETGALTANKDCDAVSVVLAFDTGAFLTYVLQRGPAWDDDSEECASLLLHPFVTLLDPNEVEYTRNVLEDAAAAGILPPTRITQIGLSVDSEGTGTFDDIRFFRPQGAGQPTPTPMIRTPTPTPCGCIHVKQGHWCLEFDGAPVDGDLTQSGCVITFSDRSARGPICGTVWTVDNEQFDVHWECDFSGGNPATECSGTATVQGEDVDLFGSAGPCDTGSELR